MFKKILKITLIALGSIVLLLVAFYAFIHFNIEGRMHKTYDNMPAESFPIPQDSATLALGAHLTVIKGCQDCHGPNLAGRVLIDDPGLGKIVTANLTRGKGGIGQHYTDEDWIRALRHGVSKDHKPLLVMPSEETTHLTQQDLAAVIAYCKSVPPVDQELPASVVKPLGRILTYFDQLSLLAVEKIDHSQKVVANINKIVSVEYGKYLSVSCIGCHKPNLKGGAPVIPGSPQVADITSTGHIVNWTEEQFLNTLRTGQTPEGKVLQNEFMPWQMTKAYTDDELKSLYLFLKSQP